MDLHQSLLNGIIGSLVAMAAVNGIPIDAAIATIAALYILKIGVNVFCKYTEDNP
jgi:divalent metal cation (Fe/Co/Zn/Cd) transporter